MPSNSDDLKPDPIKNSCKKREASPVDIALIIHCDVISEKALRLGSLQKPASARSFIHTGAQAS